jgi:hypothetical protein
MQVSELLNARFEHLRTWLQKSRPMQKLGSDGSMMFFMDICGGRVGGGMIERLSLVEGVATKLTDLALFSLFAGTVCDKSCFIARLRVFRKLHYASLASSGWMSGSLISVSLNIDSIAKPDWICVM